MGRGRCLRSAAAGRSRRYGPTVIFIVSVFGQFFAIPGRERMEVPTSLAAGGFPAGGGIRARFALPSVGGGAFPFPHLEPTLAHNKIFTCTCVCDVGWARAIVPARFSASSPLRAWFAAAAAYRARLLEADSTAELAWITSGSRP